jgi:hypothetical protein
MSPLPRCAACDARDAFAELRRVGKSKRSVPTSFQTVGTALRALAAPYELRVIAEAEGSINIAVTAEGTTHVVTACRRKPDPALEAGGFRPVAKQ